MRIRHGVSLIELLIVMGILGVLLALILPAVQKIRETASLLKSKNNLKQMTIAVHQIADIENGFIGGVIKPDPKSWREHDELWSRSVLQGSPHGLVARMLEGESLHHPQNETTGIRPYFLSPSDPSDASAHPKTRLIAPDNTWVLQHRDGGPTSYAFDTVAFIGPPKFPLDLRDGTSNTILFAECYSERYFSPDSIDAAANHYAKSWLAYGSLESALPSEFPPHPLNNRGLRRASFADAGWGDVVPVTTGYPPVTRPSVEGMTFQLKPKPRDAIPAIPQTPFSAGLPVAMFDGSVRVIRFGVDPQVFWGAVTPAGGEVAGDF